MRIVTQNEDDDDDAEYSDDYEFCSSASKPPKGRHSIDIMLADAVSVFLYHYIAISIHLCQTQFIFTVLIYKLYSFITVLEIKFEFTGRNQILEFIFYIVPNKN